MKYLKYLVSVVGMSTMLIGALNRGVATVGVEGSTYDDNIGVFTYEAVPAVQELFSDGKTLDTTDYKAALDVLDRVKRVIDFEAKGSKAASKIRPKLDSAVNFLRVSLESLNASKNSNTIQKVAQEQVKKLKSKLGDLKTSMWDETTPRDLKKGMSAVITALIEGLTPQLDAQTYDNAKKIAKEGDSLANSLKTLRENKEKVPSVLGDVKRFHANVTTLMASDKRKKSIEAAFEAIEPIIENFKNLIKGKNKELTEVRRATMNLDEFTSLSEALGNLEGRDPLMMSVRNLVVVVKDLVSSRN
ncbi:TPA: hypothetical protein DDZ86_03665 [Candidatus Dependentiae bacterium]|nr:MAG: hypothetical protein UW09_C0003G0085 [candidate division TM6 bacterium GW2011_GWF2_43_87]HBL98713.1 hypothetical protein [Candidatus Dependentiae bacterium]